LLIDGLVGSLNGRVEPSLRLRLLFATRRRSEMREEGIGCKITGNLSGGGSAHTVADDVGAGLGCSGAGILVAMADAAAVGEHGVDKVVRRHS